LDGLLWVFPDASPNAAAAAAALSPAVINELSQTEEWEPRTDWFMREIPVSMETVVENVSAASCCQTGTGVSFITSCP
jgi:phenylpropionate dioxygenase-like ring-hydroxylating dioxygenase large terminal subunit